MNPTSELTEAIQELEANYANTAKLIELALLHGTPEMKQLAASLAKGYEVQAPELAA